MVSVRVYPAGPMAAKLPSLDSDTARGAALQTLGVAASQGERLLSVVRALFCAIEAARHLIVTDMSRMGLSAFVVTLLPTITLTAFSILVLRFSKNRPLPAQFFFASVVLDWAMVLGGLLPNVIWPWPGYRGITGSTDISLLYLVVFASVFRMSPWLSALSGTLNLGSCFILFFLDYRFGLAGQPLNFNGFSLILFGCAGATGLAIAATLWTRRLVLRSALESRRRTHERRALDALMEESHGIRSVLSSAKLDVDRLAELPDEELLGAPRSLVQNLHRELSELVRLTARSRERSFAALASLQRIGRVELLELTEGVARVVGRQFPAVQFDMEGAVRDGFVGLVGGKSAFERILLNLLTNACEGDGQRLSSHVRVEFRELENGLQVTVFDDGPGFSAEQLAQPGRCGSTKSDGTGIGLFLVSRLIEESRGEFSLSNHEDGGACCRLVLPSFAVSPRQ